MFITNYLKVVQISLLYYFFCHDNGFENHSLPLDHELLIQYQFVKKRKYKQTVLVRKKQVRTYDNRNFKNSQIKSNKYVIT